MAPRWRQCATLELQVQRKCSALVTSNLPSHDWPQGKLRIGFFLVRSWKCLQSVFCEWSHWFFSGGRLLWPWLLKLLSSHCYPSVPPTSTGNYDPPSSTPRSTCPKMEFIFIIHFHPFSPKPTLLYIILNISPIHQVLASPPLHYFKCALLSTFPCTKNISYLIS